MTNTSKPSRRPSSFSRRIAGRILPVCIVFLLASTLSSCDFLRKMAGRPTSSELALLEKRRDSLEIERRLKHKHPAVEVSDTMAVATNDSASLGCRVEPADTVTDAAQIQALKEAARGVSFRRLSRSWGCAQARELFYVIAGTFKEAGNAERYAARMRRGAFPNAQVLTLHNGYSIAAAFASNSADQTLRFLSEHKSELPSEAWILINDLR